MARKGKQETSGGGAPDWMVTYGDMMSLLLCFFIMLVAMSEIKDEKFQKILESVRRAFGYDVGAEVVPGAKADTTSVLEKLESYETSTGTPEVYGGSEVINVRGEELFCKTIREDGYKITVGDKVGFEDGSAVIPPEMETTLDVVCDELIKDYPNRILIRGHASASEATGGTTDRQLSFMRARAVETYLKKRGIHPRRFRLAACGSFEPVDVNLTPAGRRSNRRVEIVISEELVEDVIPRRVIDE